MINTQERAEVKVTFFMQGVQKTATLNIHEIFAFFSITKDRVAYFLKIVLTGTVKSISRESDIANTSIRTFIVNTAGTYMTWAL